MYICVWFNILSNKELKAIKIIRNSIVHLGRMSSVRELMIRFGYKSPRSSAVLLKNLEEKEILRKKEDGSYQIVDFEIPEDFGSRQ